MLKFGTLALGAGVCPPEYIRTDGRPYIKSGDEIVNYFYPRCEAIYDVKHNTSPLERNEWMQRISRGVVEEGAT